MKYHKIPNVDKSICTAEQKVAYNIATRLDFLRDDFNQLNAINPGEAKNSCARLAEYGMRLYRQAYSYKPDKYNEDAIFSALLAGIYDYMTGRKFIATSYESVGKAFPALYL